MLRKIQNVRNAMNDAEDKFWPFSWRISSTLNKRAKSDEEYQRAASAIDVAFSQLRNTLLWSNITEKDKEIYENQFPTTKDFYDNVLIKLDESENWLLEDINSIRNTYLLPSVDLAAALNPSLRLALYKSMQDVFN
jgi:hypothetical protein